MRLLHEILQTKSLHNNVKESLDDFFFIQKF